MQEHNLYILYTHIALGADNIETAEAIMNDVHNAPNPNCLTYTQIQLRAWIHAEILRATRHNTTQLNTFIQKQAQNTHHIPLMLQGIHDQAVIHWITPIAFKRIIEQYRNHINNGVLKIVRSDLAALRSLRDIICYGDISNVAERIYNQEATHYEVAACIEYAFNAVQNYRDAHNNTFLHILAYDSSLIRFVPTIARTIMKEHTSWAYNNQNTTPVMIARKNNNTVFVEMFYMYHGLNMKTKHANIKRLLRKVRQITCCTCTPEDDAPTTQIPHDNKWDIIEIAYTPRKLNC